MTQTSSPLMSLLSTILRIEQSRLKRIFTIGIPIIGGMLSQSIINLVDAAMVGRLGEHALAGVGIGSYAAFITISLVMGLSSGVQALVARRSGEGNHHQTFAPLISGLVLGLAAGLVLSLIFISSSSLLLPIFNDDIQVQAIAQPYFDWRSAAIAAVAMNFCFRGYWAGIGKSGTYLRILLWIHALNVVISYLLIFGIPAIGFNGYGAVGSGMGTCIALYIGSLLYAITTVRALRKDKSSTANSTIESLSIHSIKKLATLALPNSMQQGLFAFGISVLFIIIGMVGTQEQAIGHILINIALLLILPSVGLGIAATSLVGHALGAKAPEDAYRWGWEVVRVAALLMAILGIPLWLAPELILKLFTNSTELIALGTLPIQISGLNIVFEVTAMVLTQALLGAGASRQVMIINISMHWLYLLPLAYFIGPWAGYGLLGIWLVQGMQRICSSLIYAYLWRKGQWSRIEI